MEWYIGLSRLLSEEDYLEADDGLGSLSLDSPVELLIHLYKAVLAYQINIVCCH